MNWEVEKINTRHLLYQRNIFAFLTVLLGLVLVINSLFLFRKQDRVIITPPFVSKEYWVESSSVSATYLEQFASFIASQVLSKTPKSAESQGVTILHHVTPEFFPIMRERLIQEEKTLQKEGASYVFFPSEVRVKEGEMKVFYTGERQLFVGDKKVASRNETYVFWFSFDGSRLLLDKLEIVEEKK